MSDNNALVHSAWNDILAALADGELVHVILARHGFTRKQVAAYRAWRPAARAEWDDARECSADALFDEALMEARRNDVAKEDAQHIRTRIDTLKWAARIRNPRHYGDKAQLDVNVRTVDLTAIIRDANARLAAAQSGRIIDGTSINCGASDALARARTDDVSAHLLPAALASLL